MKALIALGVFYILTSQALFGFYSTLPFEANTLIYLLIQFAFFYPFMYGGVKMLQVLKVTS